MGTFSCPIEVFSEDGSRSVTIEALVNTGSCFTRLPDSLLRELGIVPSRRIESELADGSVVEDEIGYVRVRLQGIESATIAVFAAESAPARLGHYTLTGSRLAVDPVNLCLVPTLALRPTRSNPQLYAKKPS